MSEPEEPASSAGVKDARETLRQMVETYGREVCLDPRRCEGLLRDLCPGEKRDISLLLTALRERIPEELVAAGPGQPVAVLAARLGKRLSDTLGLNEEAARWAVGSWALALGLASAADLPAPAAAPPPYVPPPYVPPAPPPPPPAYQQPPYQPPPRQPLYPPPPQQRSPVEAAAARIVRRIIRVSVGTAAVLGVFAFIKYGHHSPSLASQSSASQSGTLYGGAASGGAVASNSSQPAGLALPVQHWEASRPVSALALSPDGTTVATGGFKVITLWDAATGLKKRSFSITPPPQSPGQFETPDVFGGPATGEVARLCFSPDGGRLAATDYGLISLWDAKTGQKLPTPTLPTERETDTDIGFGSGGAMQRTTVRQVPVKNQNFLLFSPDGSTLAADTGDSVTAWDMTTGKRRVLLAKADATVMAFSPDGKTLAGGGSNGVVHLWDAATGKQKHAIRVVSKSAAEDAYGHAQYFTNLNAVGFNPDGKTLATAYQGEDNVRFWDASTAASRRVLPAGRVPVDTLTLRPDGTLVTLQTSDGLYLRDGKTGAALHTYLYQRRSGMMGSTFDPCPRVFALSADGRTLAAGGNGSTMASSGKNTVAIWQVTP